MSNRTSQKRSREPDQEATSSKIRNKSGSKSYDKQKENQSGQKQNTEDQSNTKTHVKSMKDKQSSQSNETSQSKNSQKNNKMNTANMEINGKDQQILKESIVVDNELRRSPRKHGQTKTENQTQEKIRKLSDSTVVTAEREGNSMTLEIQSTPVISNSKGLTETLRDIRTSTYQSWESEENNKLNNHI